MSAGLNAWTLAVLAGTLIVLFSGEYRKPRGRTRRIFLLVVPALVLLGRSLERGLYLNRVYAAFVLRPPTDESALQAVTGVNGALDAQIWAFRWAIIILGIWLLAYSLWWILFDKGDGVRPSLEGPKK
jgi:hypothetical protein